MNNKNASLRKQFLTRLLSILIVIVFLSSFVQLYFINQQIKYEIHSQSSIIGDSIEQGIKETEFASKSIEHQIDLKLISISKHISDILNTNTAAEITKEQLVSLQKQFNLSGLSIFARKGNDIVVVNSTDPNEMGFSLKNDVGDYIFKETDKFLKGNQVYLDQAYSEKNSIVFPIVQSGTHKEKKLFFKYAYYHPDNADYMINPYIVADEVYNFTEKVGPQSWIDKVTKKEATIEEIAVLNPAVFKDPSLAERIYAPLKKIVYGSYDLKGKEDTAILKKMADHPQKYTSIQKVNGEKIFKVFLPMADNNAIYIALDYNKMIGPLYRHSIILIVSGIIGLLALFFLTAKFFNNIYENIRKIKSQVIELETGDMTVKSDVKDGSELQKLSQSANRMVDTLRQTLSDTKNQALKTQQLSVLLESDASQSVEKMYSISTEATMTSREYLDEINSFLDELESFLEKQTRDQQSEEVYSKIGRMRQVAKERTAVTTDITITLSDLLKSLHYQSSQLSGIAKSLLDSMKKFKL